MPQEHLWIITDGLQYHIQQKMMSKEMNLKLKLTY
ncbi:hypothetical protein BANRA_01851 [Klebsiella pneumoniae]|nr:hypothetical protein BANRA_01851 [Klebsiella pneumoniae]